jgi:hypothetical protein
MIGIWGSCVTRDTLEIGGTLEERISYHARSSWISQAADSTTAPVEVPTGAGFGHRMVREDLTHGILPALEDDQPDVLVIDLIDERFDVVDVDGSNYSVNDYYERLGLDGHLRERADDTVRFVDPRREETFKESAQILAPRLVDALPSTTFVLHQAWYTARTADPAQPFYASAPDAVVVRNERLAAHYESLLHAFGGRLHVVEADHDLLVGDPNHKWGLAHYHYLPAYYEQIFGQLEAIRAGADLRRPVWSVTTPAARHTGARTDVSRAAKLLSRGRSIMLRPLRWAARTLAG